MIKRTLLKRAPKAPKLPLGATKTRKPPTVIKSLRTKLWELCKAITRTKYGPTCFTCGKTPLVGTGWQTGHFIPRSICGLTLRYELRNLRPQCYRCNIDLSGNGAVFYRKLVEIEGQEFVDQLFAEKTIILKETKDFYFDKIAEYKALLQELTETTV